MHPQWAKTSCSGLKRVGAPRDCAGGGRPSLRSWQRIRQTLGITEPLPEEAWRQQPREISDDLMATLGAWLAAARSATLAELAEANLWGYRRSTTGSRTAPGTR